MVKECMVILTNMTEAQAKVLSDNLSLKNNEESLLAIQKDEAEINALEETIGDLDLSEANVVNIDGILLPVYDNKNVQNGTLVPVKSTQNNLRSLALAVASGILFT